MSPDGSKVATGDTYRKVCLWDAEGRVQTKQIGIQTDKILGLCYSPVSNEVASISQDRSLMIINVDDGKTKKVPACHDAAKPEKVVVAGNGFVCTTGDDCAVRIWNNIWNMAD